MTDNNITRLRPKSLTDNALQPRATRMRRLRVSDNMRRMVRENAVTKDDMILPLFVEENTQERTAMGSLPGVWRETERSLGAKMKEAEKAGVPAVMLFGVSHNKDDEGRDSMSPDGLMARMIKRAKDSAPDVMVIADLCFCEYTDHGHCGPLTDSGSVNNDATLENLARQALVVAEAGADIVAPSGMMDGAVEAIRTALEQNGHQDVALMAYAAKFASCFYGPFRDAAGCSLKKGDRKTYQMDPANGREALREVALDIEEGADMVMVKPGLPYLDVIKDVKDTFQMPTFAYHVSGEYAMLKFAAEAGALDYNNALMETMMSFKRAGADGILTYAALDVIKQLEK